MPFFPSLIIVIGHIKENTVGAVKNGTLVFINFSAQDASILKMKRRS